MFRGHGVSLVGPWAESRLGYVTKLVKSSVQFPVGLDQYLVAAIACPYGCNNYSTTRFFLAQCLVKSSRISPKEKFQQFRQESVSFYGEKKENL